MAHYRLCIKNGRAGGAVANFQYNMGIEKYSYKDGEIITDFHNIPKWADSPADFWEKYSLNDRVNSSYKKLELSLQKDLSIEENLKMLNEFIENNIGKNFFYSVVIQDKESNEKGIQNTHAHLMICKRKEDGIERTPEQFFKRYNAKNPEQGGALTDNEYWKSKQTLINMREDWEKIQNKYLEKNNIKDTVSCKSLEFQKEEAEKNNDLLKADLYDRPAISVDNYILKKDEKDLTEREKNKLEEFKVAKEFRSFKEMVYEIELERIAEENLEKENNLKIKDLQKEIPFGETFDAIQNLFMITVEKNILQEQMKNTEYLKTEAVRKLNPEYIKIEAEIENLYKQEIPDMEKINNLEREVEEIEDNTSELKIKTEITRISMTLQEKLNSFIFSENSYKNLVDENIANINSTENAESFYNEYQYKNWENNFLLLKDTEKEIDNLEKKLKKYENNFDKDKIEDTVLNSLAKGEYLNLKKELISIDERIASQYSKISTQKDYNNVISKEEYKILEKRKEDINSSLTKIKNMFTSGKEKNFYIRREYSIKKKYTEEFFKIKSELEKNRMKVAYLENTISSIPEEKLEEYKNRYMENKLDIENRELKAELYKLEIQEKKINSSMSEVLFEKYALNKLTNGEYDKLFKEYSNLLVEKNKTGDNDGSIQEKLDELENTQKKLISKFTLKDISRLKTAYHKRYSREIGKVRFRAENVKRRIDRNEKLLNSKPQFKGSYHNLKNFSRDNVKAELGKILYTGNINISSSDDVWAKQMKKELDFSR